MTGRYIGIDGSRLTVAPRTGTENYSINLLRTIADLEFPDHIVTYLNSTNPEPLQFPGEPVCIPAPRFWTQGRLSLEMARNPPDVLFVPSHSIPLIHPRTVVTIHDVGFMEFPETYSPRARRRLEWTTRWCLQVAHQVIVPSTATRNEIVKWFDVDHDRVAVIPHGVTQPIDAASTEESVILLPSGLKNPFVLAVGTIQPRKNVTRLIEAFEAVVMAGLPHDLVIAGQDGYESEEMDRALAGIDWRHRVHRPGYLADSMLQALYRNASLLCFVSLHEGFGMPILEAMANGLPVLTSNRSCMPEVADGAARLVDPTDTQAIASALIDLLGDPDRLHSLKMKGLQRAATATWQSSANQTMALLRDVRDFSD